MKKKVFLVLIGIIFTGYAPYNVHAIINGTSSLVVGNIVESLGSSWTPYQGRLLEISARSSYVPTARDNALIRASWEAHQLGYDYFMIISEKSDVIPGTSGYRATESSNSYTNIFTPGARTGTSYSVVMIILCCSEDELLGDKPRFPVSTRLSTAQRILKEESEKERKQRSPWIYFDTGIATVGVIFDNFHNDFDNDFTTATYFLRMAEMRIGYGPFGKIPLYAVAESTISWVNYFPFFIGAGAIIYPTRIFQLGFSLGRLWPLGINDNIGNMYGVVVESGFSWNVSAAFDLGLYRNNGLLLGLQLLGSRNNYNGYSYLYGFEREVSGTLSSTYLSVLVRYAYRRKIPKQTVW